MVLGMRSKNRNSPSVQLDYHMQIQVVKPWPPSQSMRSLRAVLIQWEYGDRKSGSTKSVVPTMGSVVGEGKIEFNESFRLPVTLLRDMSVKNADVDTFQKNCLEFNLYEPRRDKTAKGQLLATAMVNLADYGIVKDVISLNIPMNCKRTVRNTTQALLYLKIQPVDKLRTNSLSKEASLGKDGSESVSALMNEEYDDEAEIASFTDDDVASHSSLGVSSSSAFNSVSGQNRNEENGSAAVTNESTWKSNKKNTSDKKLVLENSNMPHIKPSGMPKASSSCSSSIALSSGPPSPQEGYYSTPDSPHTSLTNTLSLGNKNTHDRYNVSTNAIDNSFTAEESCGKIPVSRSAAQNGHQQLDMKNSVCNFASKVSSQHNNQKYLDKLESRDSNDLQFDGNAHRVGSIGRDHLKEDATGDNICFLEEKVRKEQENAEARWQLQEKMHSRADELLDRPEGTDKEDIVSGKSLPSSKVNIGFKENIQKSEHPKPVKSVRSPLDPARTSSLLSSGGKEVNAITNRKDSSVFPRDSRTAVLENKMQQLESQITMLEGELREAAAIEAAVYSVAAEHGCSISKVHAPARRLSRLYLHACKENVKSQMASAARSAVSGLILVAKACGNDVSRLTFWLSNSVVLRAIVSQSIEDHQLPVSSRISVERNTGDYRSKRISSQLNSVRKGNNNLGHGSVGDWDDPHAFTSALENAEAWIFSRIIDSIWWQTLTPYMQSTVRREIDKGLESACKKNLGRMSSSVDQEQGSFSLDLWKRAFKDACEQLCPVRAGGHECSCLPMLARLVMEQCIIRLDVAMFNAILRESVDDIPTDPVSDPISDLKVLPIPAGKSSFGAGAQLKNTIGNWSRWLTDLFGINDDDPSDNESNYTDDDKSRDKCFKPFYLLNALSDLMMLPKDMLLNKSIRKEVCLTFGAPLIKKVLDIFLPDEFCPDPIPNGVMEALDSEDPPEAGEGSIVDFPCTAAPPLYSPPSASTISDIVGDNGNRAQLRRKGSSVLKKSNTSDDELEDLDSPLAFILADDSHPSAMKNNSSWGVKRGGSNPSSVRYELLRNVWLNGK